jgi:hypothetical protein
MYFLYKAEQIFEPDYYYYYYGVLSPNKVFHFQMVSLCYTPSYSARVGKAWKWRMNIINLRNKHLK